MSRYYDFSILSPKEFEFLCRDLIQRKISEGIKASFLFNSFSEGSDGGIDAIYKDKDQYVVLQCKRYKVFDSLYAHLRRSELPKVKKLNPKRYILAVSLDLSQRQIDKLYDLFEPYIQDIGDICGAAMLNNLLTCYSDIELNYPSLFLNNMLMLDRLLNADVLNDSDAKINEFRRVARFYVQSDAFGKALSVLKKSHYVIISGEAGVGKSTMAGMLSLYYADKGYEFIFVRRDIRDGRRLLKKGKKQLFLFDDFLGSTTFHHFDRNEDRDLFDFIRDINKSPDKLLLITTREYVFRQAEIRYPELRDLEYAKCVIEQKEFTKSFKINILYNYLYYSRVEWRHIQPFLWDKNYEWIIHNRNFTPRLINDYIEKFYDLESYDNGFFYGLKKYVDDPYEYWERVFLKLSESAQMLLLILTITEEPAIEDVIFGTFKKLGSYRQLFKNGYETDTFKMALGELTGSFIAIRYNPDIDRKEGSISSLDMSLIFMPYSNAAFIGFQNPSIKDFSVKYLSKRMDLVEYLIQSVVAFNQLFLVFTTRSDDTHIDDDEAEFPHHGDKLLLPEYLQQLVISKITSEFNILRIWKVRHIFWKGDKESYHIDDGLTKDRIEKLRLLTFYFPFERYPVIREFVADIYMRIINEDREYEKDWKTGEKKGMSPLSLEERVGQPELIKKLSEFIQFDPINTIEEYYENIRFSKEFINLYDLGKLFPEAYHQIITENIKRVRKKIRDMIYDDIDYYLWEGTHEAEEGLSELLDEDLGELMEIYKFKLSKTFKRSVNDMSGRDLFWILEEPEYLDKEYENNAEEDDEREDNTTEKESKALDRQKYDGYQVAIEQLRPEWGDSWSRLAACRYIYSKFTLGMARQLIKRVFSCEHYGDWVNGPQELDSLLNYLTTFSEEPVTQSALYDGLLMASNVSRDNLTALQAAAYYLCTVDHFVFKKETVEQFLDIQLYDQFVAQRDIWFTFFDHDFHRYLAARYIAALPDKGKIDIYSVIVQLFGDRNRIWKFSYELDGQLFKRYFLIPELEKELSPLANLTTDDKVFRLLERYSLYYDFQYDDDEKAFELISCGGGNATMEDIIHILGWNANDLSDEVGDCFNLSYLKDPLTKKYLEEYCPVKDATYSININKEIMNDGFREIVNTSGMKEKVMKYIDGLSQILNELTCRKE